MEDLEKKTVGASFEDDISIKRTNEQAINLQKVKGKITKASGKSTKKGNGHMSWKEEVVNPLLLDQWEMEVPDIKNGRAILSLEKNNVMELSIQAHWTKN